MIDIITQQIAWGRRVRGIVKESDLIEWYERCLRGKFKGKLASPLLQRLAEGFKAEFPQNDGLAEFISERGYDRIIPPDLWKI